MGGAVKFLPEDNSPCPLTMGERMPLRDLLNHAPIFCRLQCTDFLFFEGMHHKAVILCISPHATSRVYAVPELLVLALVTTDQERRLGWHCRVGASIPFTTPPLLSASSGENAEARTFYITWFLSLCWLKWKYVFP